MIIPRIFISRSSDNFNITVFASEVFVKGVVGKIASKKDFFKSVGLTAVFF
jgi:hypothetical protein